MPKVWIGIGSNLDDPVAQVQQAIEQLRNWPDTCLLACSSLYVTAAIGPEQPDFINAVVVFNTPRPPLELLTTLQQLEAVAGRADVATREYWGPRPLDLDILLYGDAEIRTKQLVVPHPRIDERAFVLVPMLEICHRMGWGLSLPNLLPLDQMMAACPPQRIEKYTESLFL